jgi:hypothetical protein
MDVATARVIRGFLMLTENQRQEFVSAVNPLQRGEVTRKFVLDESEKIIRVYTGPVGSTCGCCGK